MRFDDGFFERMAQPMRKAFEAMDALERGAIANPDENRMVGHYWLRAPELAPSAEIADEIRKTVQQVKKFAAAVHRGAVCPTHASRFTRVLSIGIGGSALGPMFVADALGNPASDAMKVDFIDNTDSDGIARTLDLSVHWRVNSKTAGTASSVNAQGVNLVRLIHGAIGDREPHRMVRSRTTRTQRQRSGRPAACLPLKDAGERIGGCERGVLWRSGLQFKSPLPQIVREVWYPFRYSRLSRTIWGRGLGGGAASPSRLYDAESFLEANRFGAAKKRPP
jgi:hypothetical protein